MVEISGLSIAGDRLFAVSDRDHELLSLPLEDAEALTLNMDSSDRLDLASGLPAQEQAQWEAVSVNESSGVFALQESESKIFQFDADGRNLKSFQLGAWQGRNDESRGFEGLMLMRSGHFLVALETDTAALIEYGPKGESPIGLSPGNRALLASNETFNPPDATELVPLASWTLKEGAGSCKYSDLARADDGGILILMKGCMKVAQVTELSLSKDTFTVDRSWAIPSSIEHPEGLQALGDRGLLISSDIKTKTNNLYWLTFPNY